jgi:predicted RNA binding protein YcfA (HicA-like mRNA interferase family)
MKLPRDLSGDELCRALKRLGFEFVRQTGSHRHYTKDGLHPCVPMHREIKSKTLQSILKQATSRWTNCWKIFERSHSFFGTISSKSFFN